MAESSSSSTQSRQLFGTDGIRGAANVHPLTPAFVLRLGRALGRQLLESGARSSANVLIGRDTRISGGMLESALAAGLNSVGVDVALAGVIPTPGVAFLTRDLGFAMGIVISASHNPYPDNGIKLFNADGYKLDDAHELAIEQRVLSPAIEDTAGDPTRGNIGRLAPLEDAAERYIEFAVHSLTHSRSPADGAAPLRGLRVALDNANGAAFFTSAEILRRLGADCVPLHSEPNGVNINEACGCTHPDAILRAVRDTGAAVGVTHDGDADRVLLCDENGELLDGDELMAIAATAMLEEGSLAGKTLVATLMSNFGLNEAIESRGGTVVRTAVGDRYVIEKMRAGGFNLGGEQSGHFIFRDINTTGDGIVAALQILRIMTEAGKPLSDLKRVLAKYPQAQRNLLVTTKPPVEELAEARALIAETEQTLGDSGRVLLRYSGTEPKIRLLIEGKESAYIEAQADRIADAIAARIGAS